MSRITAGTKERTGIVRAKSFYQGKEKGDVLAYLYLLITRTYPNCVSTKEFLKGQNYQIIDTEERPDLAEKLGIMQAPTLMITSDGIMQEPANTSNIRRSARQNHTGIVRA